jgi:hypothetical protein
MPEIGHKKTGCTMLIHVDQYPTGHLFNYLCNTVYMTYIRTRINQKEISLEKKWSQTPVSYWLYNSINVKQSTIQNDKRAGTQLSNLEITAEIPSN